MHPDEKPQNKLTEMQEDSATTLKVSETSEESDDGTSSVETSSQPSTPTSPRPGKEDDDEQEEDNDPEYVPPSPTRDETKPAPPTNPVASEGVVEKSPSQSLPLNAKAAAGTRVCAYCGARTTPMWRHGPPSFDPLCNSCGVKWRRGRILQEYQRSSQVTVVKRRTSAASSNGSPETKAAKPPKPSKAIKKSTSSNLLTDDTPSRRIQPSRGSAPGPSPVQMPASDTNNAVEVVEEKLIEPIPEETVEEPAKSSAAPPPKIPKIVFKKPVAPTTEKTGASRMRRAPSGTLTLNTPMKFDGAAFKEPKTAPNMKVNPVFATPLPQLPALTDATPVIAEPKKFKVANSVPPKFHRRGTPPASPGSKPRTLPLSYLQTVPYPSPILASDYDLLEGDSDEEQSSLFQPSFKDPFQDRARMLRKIYDADLDVTTRVLRVLYESGSVHFDLDQELRDIVFDVSTLNESVFQRLAAVLDQSE